LFSSNVQPVLSAATGTTSALTIPTQFNGDTLSMMHSVYADGTNAGPANWTPYQAYGPATLKGSSFEADYGNSTIVLDPDSWPRSTTASR